MTQVPSLGYTLPESLIIERRANALFEAVLVKALKKRPEFVMRRATSAEQYRGIDYVIEITLYNGVRVPVAYIDTKGDAHLTPNVTSELFGEDRPRRLPTPAPGWMRKEGMLIPHVFTLTGEIFLFNLKEAAPHLEGLFQESMRLGYPKDFWVTGAVNDARYIAYNMVLKMKYLLRSCPGVHYMDTKNFLPYEQICELLEIDELEGNRLNDPLGRELHTADEFLDTLLLSPGTMPVQTFTSEQMEREIRWLEQRATFVGKHKHLGDAVRAERIRYKSGT